jgi:hypothetical protein
MENGRMSRAYDRCPESEFQFTEVLRISHGSYFSSANCKKFVPPKLFGQQQSSRDGVRTHRG